MQVTGTIDVVRPRIDTNTNAQRSWQSYGKTNFVYDMTISGQNGPISGEISSRKEGQYPKNVGDQITVNVTTNDYGNKFSAVLDQQGQQQGNQGYQQQPQQGSQGYQSHNHQQVTQPQQQQRPPQQDSTQARIAFAQACNIANFQYCYGKIEKTEMSETVHIWEKILNKKGWPFDMAMQSPQQQAPPPQQQQAPAQDFDSPPFNPTDDIPF